MYTVHLFITCIYTSGVGRGVYVCVYTHFLNVRDTAFSSIVKLSTQSNCIFCFGTFLFITGCGGGVCQNIYKCVCVHTFSYIHECVRDTSFIDCTCKTVDPIEWYLLLWCIPIHYRVWCCVPTAMVMYRDTRIELKSPRGCLWQCLGNIQIHLHFCDDGLANILQISW